MPWKHMKTLLFPNSTFALTQIFGVLLVLLCFGHYTFKMFVLVFIIYFNWSKYCFEVIVSKSWVPNCLFQSMARWLKKTETTRWPLSIFQTLNTICTIFENNFFYWAIISCFLVTKKKKKTKNSERYRIYLFWLLLKVEIYFHDSFFILLENHNN